MTKYYATSKCLTLFVLLLLASTQFSFAQCEQVLDVDFNHRSGNEIYTVNKANADFGTVRAWTSSTIRGLDGTSQDFPHTTRVINGELRAEYIKNDAGGYAGGFLFDREFEPTEEAVLEYKVKFDKDFVWATGGKLPGLGGTTRTNPGAIPSGCTTNQENIDNGFSCRLMWRRNRAQTDQPYLILYLYHPYKDRCGDNIRIFTGLKKDQWYTIRQYVKMNTPGQSNGIVRMWIDGERVLNMTNVLLRKSGKNNVKVNALVLNTYRGGSRTDPVWHSPTTDYAYFDDFKVWRNCSDPGNIIDVNNPPTVSFDGATQTQLAEGYSDFYIKANASDPDNNLSSVTLFIDGEEVRSESVAPYEWGHATTPNPNETLNLTPGTHTLRVVAVDSEGASAEATVQVQVVGIDCHGDMGGSAEVDNCGVCSGGNTGLVPDASCSDCAGVPNGTAEVDACGVCSGGNTGIEVDACQACYDAYASSDDGNTPENVLDEDYYTRWSALGEGEFIELCLGTPQVIDRVSIAFYKGDERQSHFDLLSSMDGITYEPLMMGVQSSGTTLEMEDFSVEPKEVWKLRVVGKGNSSNAWNSITEISYGILTLNIEDKNQTSLRIYPNPAQDLVQISGLAHAQSWEVRNALGTLVMKGESLEVDVRQLVSGVYTLKVGHQILSFQKI